MSSPVSRTHDRPSLAVGLAVWLFALAVSTVTFQVAVSASGHAKEDLDALPFWLYPTVAMIGLWVPTMAGLWWAARRFGGRSLSDTYGLRFSRTDLLGEIGRAHV